MGFGNIGIGELMVVFLVVMLVFGPKRMPEIARNMGKFMRDFRRETSSAINELKSGIEPVTVGIFDEPDAGAASMPNGGGAPSPGVAAAGGAGIVEPEAHAPAPANGARKTPAKKASAARAKTRRPAPAAKRRTASPPAKKRTPAAKAKRPASRSGAARKR